MRSRWRSCTGGHSWRRHQAPLQESGRGEEELEKEVERQEEDNAQTTMCACMDGMRWKDTARPLSQCDGVNTLVQRI